MPPRESTLRLVNGKAVARSAPSKVKRLHQNYATGDLQIKGNLFGLDYGVGC